MNDWIDYLIPIINEYADGSDLDDNDIEDLGNIIKAKIRLHLGIITEEEYNKVTAVPRNDVARILELEKTLEIIRSDAKLALANEWGRGDDGFQAQVELIDSALSGESVGVYFSAFDMQTGTFLHSGRNSCTEKECAMDVMEYLFSGPAEDGDPTQEEIKKFSLEEMKEFLGSTEILIEQHEERMEDWC